MSDLSPLLVEKKTKKAVRFVFSTEGDEIHLISRHSVEMTLPPSVPMDANEGCTGFWYELRDEKDRPLYRRVMHNPISKDVEVFSDNPEQPSISRQSLSNRNKILVALVPDLETGHSVTLLSGDHKFRSDDPNPLIIARFMMQNNSLSDSTETF